MDIKEVIYDWCGYNAKIFYAINGIQSEPIQKFMLMGSSLGSNKMFFIYFATLLFIAVLFSLRKKNNGRHSKKTYRNLWMKVLTTLGLSYAFSYFWVRYLKEHCHFPRPFIALPEGTVNILQSVRTGANEDVMRSFPSGHASFSMIMVAGIWPLLNLPGKMLAVFYLIWVGLSRISLGVHFPVDVLGGFIMSFMAVYVIRFFVDKFYTQSMGVYKS
jgi:membrane-associated phospholipid phosphatase